MSKNITIILLILLMPIVYWKGYARGINSVQPIFIKTIVPANQGLPLA